MAANGATALHEGPIATAIVAAVRTASRNPGDLTAADLAGYRAKVRAPICVTYRGNRVCSMGPPSSGGYTIGATLMLLEGFGLGGGPGAALAPGALHLVAEAEKLAFADRNWYLADADFVPPPAGLLDPAYIAERRRLISSVSTLARPYPGVPPGASKLTLGTDATAELPGTSHISIVDGEGQAVALTTSIETAFGSGLWAAGFLLNNQLTDFSRSPRDRDGRPIANRVEGGKRPRSSMTPTIVLDPQGQLRLVTGSPGGSRISPYVVKTLICVLDWRLDAQAAVTLIGTLEGGADPRREGVALGD